MAIYKYHVVDKNGTQIKGEQEAASEEKLGNFLHSQNYVIISIDEKIQFLKELTQNRMPEVSLKQRVIFAKQMATMIGAGLPLIQVMEIEIQQTKDEALRKNLENVLSDIEKGGVTLSEALKKNTKMFNEVQINLIKAGESSGNLFEMLHKVALDLDKSKQLKSKIQNAMIYPIIVFVVIAVVMVVMMVYMVPAVKELFDDFNIEKLPPITEFLVNMSSFFTNPISILLLLLLIILGVVAYRYYDSTEGGRHNIDKLKLKVPVFGNLTAKVHIAEFSRLLSMLLKSGIPIVQSLNIVNGALSNVHFKDALVEGVKDVQAGLPLALALSKSEVYPPLVVRMVGIGEETGKLDNILEDMAKFYDDEVMEISENLSKLMEPLILVVVGGLVAFLAVGIYLPIYSIGQNI
jgi:type IV pilus assembly protein PilC